MKFVSFIICAMLGMVGNAQPVSDAAQICTKACQAAPVEQRETCLRVCTQFAEQSAGLVPSSTAVVATTSAPVKNMKPTGSPAPVATSSANSGKSRGEDNDEDNEYSMESSSLSHPVSDASKAYMNAVAVLAIISTTFL
ncbi:hypothetical protein H4R22_001211 [Coemansia sp. RSA 1290]|nr:hypothetical protein H4R22_001211 [Coemansia sp. RSA 1290]